MIEEDVVTNPSAKLGTYAGRVIVTPSVFERFNSSLFEWVNVACKSAYALVLTYGHFDNALGYLEFAFPNDFAGASCRTYTISVPSYNRIADLLKNETGFVKIDAADGASISPIRSWYQSGWFIFLTVAMAAISCGVACVGVVRLWFYWRSTETCYPQIATICLWLETAGSFVRFLYWGLDPFGSRRIIPYPGSHSAFRTASFPFLISSTILLTFYWPETLSTTSLKISLNVSKFRIPAYILCMLAFFFEAVSFIWYFGSFTTATQLRIFNQVYYVFVSLGMALFYIATAVRIFLALRKRAHSSNHGGSDSSGSSGFRGFSACKTMR
eukprot:TRINITY_DN14339_c0_g1_i1.p1 TRINITY_DN14339_c0_g1~~TRINITY_DN14339_c0_g1_i1.p1  ORF type:complete len:327 (+),score=14.53 TRINITY_DN14339_c0_g1_i1:128-1108(+)